MFPAVIVRASEQAATTDPLYALVVLILIILMVGGWVSKIRGN